MTSEVFAEFAVCLEYKPSGTSPAWDEGCARYYFAMLEDIPDEAMPALKKAVGTGFKFRPEPCEIIEAWQKISAAPSPQAEELIGRMLMLRRRNGVYQARVPGGECWEWERREPPWTDPLCAAASRMMGGWNEFCCDDSPPGVLRGQLRKAAEAALAGQSPGVMERLALEYREARAALPQPPAPPPVLHGQTADRDDELPELAISRTQAARIMSGLSGRLPKAVSVGVPHRDRAAIALPHNRENDEAKSAGGEATTAAVPVR